jgi:hypothetical protein
LLEFTLAVAGVREVDKRRRGLAEVSAEMQHQVGDGVLSIGAAPPELVMGEASQAVVDAGRVDLKLLGGNFRGTALRWSRPWQTV